MFITKRAFPLPTSDLTLRVPFFLMSFLRNRISLLSVFGFLSLIVIFCFSPQNSDPKKLSITNNRNLNPKLKIKIFNLPDKFNYGLLDLYWSMSGVDSRINSDPDASMRAKIQSQNRNLEKPYPSNPLIKQYSAEYWILKDLEKMRAGSAKGSEFYEVVGDDEEFDVVFVPFFATLSAEIELGWGKKKGGFLKKDKEQNEDYKRQKEVVEMVMGSKDWRRSGGRDHVYVLTDPVAMWHVRKEIAPAILLVVDFGGWYKLDSKGSSVGNSSTMIQHTQVSLLKDVIVPYTHLLPRLLLSENKHRNTLLYFKGAKHRHRGGLVREKLWDLLINEPDTVIEEGFPNATGREQSIKGMRNSDFCLHPAGDTPTSCRLFDAIQSLCIPVIVSDNIELPFEGMVDYTTFSVFVSVNNALQPNWLVGHLRSFSQKDRSTLRENMARVQRIYDYENGDGDGAVNHIWRKINQKVPMIKEAVVREKRKPVGVDVPLRCHCV